MTFDLAWDLLAWAKKFELPKLADKCVKFIGRHLLHKNVCKAYQLAKLLNHEDLSHRFLNEICEDAEAIMANKAFQFLDISQECLVEILSQAKINATEIQLFEGIQRWAISECQRQGLDAYDAKNQRKCLGKALFLIRYCSMKESEFLNGPCKSGLLEEVEQKAILWQWKPPPREMRPSLNYMDKSPCSRKTGMSGKVFIYKLWFFKKSFAFCSFGATVENSTSLAMLANGGFSGFEQKETESHHRGTPFKTRQIKTITFQKIRQIKAGKNKHFKEQVLEIFQFWSRNLRLIAIRGMIRRLANSFV